LLTIPSDKLLCFGGRGEHIFSYKHPFQRGIQRSKKLRKKLSIPQSGRVLQNLNRQRHMIQALPYLCRRESAACHGIFLHSSCQNLWPKKTLITKHTLVGLLKTSLHWGVLKYPTTVDSLNVNFWCNGLWHYGTILQTINICKISRLYTVVHQRNFRYVHKL